MTNKSLHVLFAIDRSPIPMGELPVELQKCYFLAIINGAPRKMDGFPIKISFSRIVGEALPLTCLQQIDRHNFVATTSKAESDRLRALHLAQKHQLHLPRSFLELRFEKEDGLGGPWVWLSVLLQGQDMLLLGPPGSLRRQLALRFCGWVAPQEPRESLQPGSTSHCPPFINHWMCHGSRLITLLWDGHPQGILTLGMINPDEWIGNSHAPQTGNIISVALWWHMNIWSMFVFSFEYACHQYV